MWDNYLTNFLWLGGIGYVIFFQRYHLTSLVQTVSRLESELYQAREDIIRVKGELNQLRQHTTSNNNHLKRLDTQIVNLRQGVSLINKTMESQASTPTRWSWK
jgi:predicted nuclease with TOPRIM domain